jgi:SAM-dependent methyltransferase
MGETNGAPMGESSLLGKVSLFLQEKSQAKVPNVLINRVLRSAAWSNITTAASVGYTTQRLDLHSGEAAIWAQKYYPDYLKQYGSIAHKKLMEFYTSFYLLEPMDQHVFMDAGGGYDGYLSKLSCARKILQDIRIAPGLQELLQVECIESSAEAISLPDQSVDRISCHHSFEHFQYDSDIGFIKEVQRILKPGGMCCILPLFIAEKYADITDMLTLKYKFDKKSIRIIDPSATLPGRSFSGNYARAYDVQAFCARIMHTIELERFEVTLYELYLDGKLVPDMSLDCHKRITGINFPYRALIIRRKE